MVPPFSKVFKEDGFVAAPKFCSLDELSDTVKDLPYQIIEDQRQLVKVRVNENDFTPQELSAEI